MGDGSSQVYWALNRFRQSNGQPLLWPAFRTQQDTAQAHAKEVPPGYVLVKYAGPSIRQDRPSDVDWAPAAELLQYKQNVRRVLDRQSARLGAHQQAFQQAMAAVDRIAQQSSVEDFRALERKILDAVRRVPSKPQSPFQLFVADRVPVLARNAQELGKAFHAENLQRQLTEEFTNLPFESVQDLKNRVEADFHATMSDVLTFVRQAGIAYLRMCEESQQVPHREIVPVVHLTLHGAAVTNGAAATIGPAGQTCGSADTSRVNVSAAAVQLTAPLTSPPEDLYVMVMCNNVTGRLHPASCRVEANGKKMSATQFEQFAGCASAKKWRASLKVIPGSCPECPEGAPPMQVGRWFDMKGLATAAARSKARKP